MCGVGGWVGTGERLIALGFTQVHLIYMYVCMRV